MEKPCYDGIRRVGIIAALGRDGQLGLNGLTPWDHREDLRYFRSRTLGGAVVMGRKTFETVGVLDGRTTVYQSLSNTIVYDSSGKTTYSKMSPDEILDLLPNKAIWIAGGAQIYDLWIAWALKNNVVMDVRLTVVPYAGDADANMPLPWNY